MKIVNLLFKFHFHVKNIWGSGGGGIKARKRFVSVYNYRLQSITGHIIPTIENRQE